jgi:hypothetical protein
LPGSGWPFELDLIFSSPSVQSFQLGMSAETRLGAVQMIDLRFLHQTRKSEGNAFHHHSCDRSQACQGLKLESQARVARLQLLPKILEISP